MTVGLHVMAINLFALESLDCKQVLLLNQASRHCRKVFCLDSLYGMDYKPFRVDDESLFS